MWIIPLLQSDNGIKRLAKRRWVEGGILEMEAVGKLMKLGSCIFAVTYSGGFNFRNRRRLSSGSFS
jgi:hypothetical protein